MPSWLVKKEMKLLLEEELWLCSAFYVGFAGRCEG